MTFKNIIIIFFLISSNIFSFLVASRTNSKVKIIREHFTGRQKAKKTLTENKVLEIMNYVSKLTEYFSNENLIFDHSLIKQITKEILNTGPNTSKYMSTEFNYTLSLIDISILNENSTKKSIYIILPSNRSYSPAIIIHEFEKKLLIKTDLIKNGLTNLNSSENLITSHSNNAPIRSKNYLIKTSKHFNTKRNKPTTNKTYFSIYSQVKTLSTKNQNVNSTTTNIPTKNSDNITVFGFFLGFFVFTAFLAILVFKFKNFNIKYFKNRRLVQRFSRF